MLIIVELLMGVSASVVFFAMVGYPCLLNVLDKIFKAPQNRVNDKYEPTVTFMIVAHNEEKVIGNKLENAIILDYPKDKFEILVASDNSTDKTNQIVTDFIENHPEQNIRLYISKEHLGKTHAQNEAQKTVESEILVMTDANTIVETSAIRELVSYFTSDDVAYVCGRLVYTNTNNDTSDSEATYWDMDLKMRDIESRMQTITAGNGALYACRNSEYKDYDPIQCHDSAMPFDFAIKGKKALFNPKAVAYEKAGENNNDEFKRKVRMNRTILSILHDGIKSLDIRKYKWFTVFYFGHRICRYSLWIMHIIFFLCSILLIPFGKKKTGLALVGLQIGGLATGIWSIKHTINNKWIRLGGYYVMTVLAQGVAASKQISGKSSSIWSKADSTR